MPQKPSASGRQTEVRDAMDRVLDAEKASREAIAEARRRAAEIIAACNEEIRRLEQRTARRIRRMHRICAGALRREAARQAESDRATITMVGDEERGALRAAARRLAAELTGGDREERRGI